jgi:hypothetical protein
MTESCVKNDAAAVVSDSVGKGDLDTFESRPLRIDTSGSCRKKIKHCITGVKGVIELGKHAQQQKIRSVEDCSIVGAANRKHRIVGETADKVKSAA